MGELHVFVAVDARAVQPLLHQQLLEQHPCARVRIAIDETHRRFQQLRQRCDVKGITAFDHQAHFASHEADDAMTALRQQFPAGRDALLAQAPLWQMHARQIAGPVRE